MTRDGLWQHQIGAVEMVERFLSAQEGAKGPSALVRMPTGTGKSGVIAVSAQELVLGADVLLPLHGTRSSSSLPMTSPPGFGLASVLPCRLTKRS